MKRWIILLLCAVLAAALLLTGAAPSTTGAFSVGTVRSFTLAADPTYTNEATANGADAIEALRALLASATETAPTISMDGEEVASLTVDSTDKLRTFSIVKEEEGGYVLYHSGQGRKVSYDRINALVNTIGSAKVYKFRSPPLASFEVGGERLEMGGDSQVGIDKGKLQYRRISGVFNAGVFPSLSEFYDLPYTDGSLYIPTFSYEPDTIKVRVVGPNRKSGQRYTWEGTLQQAKAYKLPEPDSYTVYFDLGFDNPYLTGDIVYGYGIFNNDLQGDVKFSAEGADTHLGEVVVLRVTGTTAQSPLATFTSDISLNLPPKFHRQADGSQIALFPVSYRNTAGSHWITVTCGVDEAKFQITAKDKKWQIQNLTVSSSTAEETINSQKANDEYERVIAPLRSVEDDKQHWSGRFILPVSDQKVTTEFGMIRYVNGAPTSTRHGAIDLAAPRGTPVKATGAGRVLYAGFLQLTGNTVLIEHGYGLKSWYYHMDSLNVSTGDMVKQAQVVGAVGSTGFSTGPHLHFGMSVNNVFINPYTAINTDLLG